MSYLNKFAKGLLVLFGLGADIVTVTSGTAGNVGNVVSDLITYLSAKLLNVAETLTVLDQFGEKEPLPSNNSKTIRFNRLEKFSVSSSPTQLTEGISPDASGLTMNQFEATAEQYGFIVRISDLAELTARHNNVERTLYLLGLQAAETYDQLIFNVLDAASNNYRPNSRANDAALLGGDLIGYKDLVSLAATMSDNAARPFGGGEYVFVTPPQVYAGLQNDPDFKASNQFQSPDKIWRGEVGMLANFRVVKSNAPAFAAVTSAVSGQSNKIYSSFALGEFAYQITDLQNLRVYVVAPGGHTDALQQSRKIGWKFAFKTLITNQNWIRRVRSSGLSSVTNP